MYVMQQEIHKILVRNGGLDLMVMVYLEMLNS